MSFSASASSSASATSVSTASATGNNVDEAYQNANNSAHTAAYFSLAPPIHPGKGVPKTCEQLCLSCIDFRFVPDFVYNQNIKGDQDNYDQCV